jgi:putative ABC transport system permease protein
MGILLLLSLSRPARLELLVRLRTMGVEPRRDRAIGAIETLPGVLLAIAVGVATAIVVPRVLSSALNLGPLVGALPVTVTIPPAIVGIVVLAAVDLALLAMIIDARQAARSDLAQALRRGDRA